MCVSHEDSHSLPHLGEGIYVYTSAIRYRSLFAGPRAEGCTRRQVKKGCEQKVDGEEDCKANKGMWGDWLPLWQGAALLAVNR